MHVEHPAVDGSGARLPRVLPLAPPVDNACHIRIRSSGRMVLPCGHVAPHAPAHDGRDAVQRTLAFCLHTPFPFHASAVSGDRLAGRCAVVFGRDADCIHLLLRRILQLVGQQRDTCAHPVRPCHACAGRGADVPDTSSVDRTAHVAQPQAAGTVVHGTGGRGVYGNGARARGGVLRGWYGVAQIYEDGAQLADDGRCGLRLHLCPAVAQGVAARARAPHSHRSGCVHSLRALLLFHRVY